VCSAICILVSGISDGIRTEEEIVTAVLRPFDLPRGFAVATAIACMFTFAALALGTRQEMTGGSVDEKFRGVWVPSRAACTSALRVVIESNKVTFVKGADRAEYDKLDQCFACAGHDVENVTLLTTDAQGDSPFTIYLDGSKRRPSVEAIFNDKKLAARFALGKSPLKKCK
jgi:hypothetical protein